MSNPSSSEPTPVRLDPSKVYGSYDRPDPDVVLGTDPIWNAAAGRLRKMAAAEEEGRFDDASYHREMAESHIQNLLEVYRKSVPSQG